MESVLHPVGGKFGRQEQVERARFLVEAAELDRLDPLAVQLVAQILAQALADVRPIGGQVHRFCLPSFILRIASRFRAVSILSAMRSHPNHFEPPSLKDRLSAPAMTHRAQAKLRHRP